MHQILKSPVPMKSNATQVDETTKMCPIWMKYVEVDQHVYIWVKTYNIIHMWLHHSHCSNDMSPAQLSRTHEKIKNDPDSSKNSLGPNFCS